jgi:hypothetical protein
MVDIAKESEDNLIVKGSSLLGCYNLIFSNRNINYNNSYITRGFHNSSRLYADNLNNFSDNANDNVVDHPNTSANVPMTDEDVTFPDPLPTNSTFFQYKK